MNDFRRSLFEEVARSELPGLCFTFVWNLDGAGDRFFLEEACDLFAEHGADIAFIELKADLDRRLTAEIHSGVISPTDRGVRTCARTRSFLSSIEQKEE